ncbi:hypothetical protein [Pseudoroseicyclus aestuarii]|uniref:Lipoprotein n=1 Tax=Pseudoroseicyclus aestuarii TaxID=1795041 RepID=A0A318TBR6_9RHOB|nr:hypothetical protein [Pseudoroseicyclus aestuarii]PYE85778.1 hypothetical protein DFP88_101450 [Pseudoroseicyclus aestuarii]
MIRKALILAALLALSACSPPAQFRTCPPEGGIGGTGACAIQPEALPAARV